MRESSADAGSAWLEMRDHARKIERELKEVRTALVHALNYCESAGHEQALHDLNGNEVGMFDVYDS